MKVCRKCSREFEQKNCEHCARARVKAWRLADPARADALSKAQAKRRAKVTAEYHAEYAKTHAEKLAAYRKAYHAVYKIANSEKLKENSRLYRKANPEKGRINLQNRRDRQRGCGGRLSHGLADRLKVLQKGKCACCKRELGQNYHMDHIVPIALGGANEDYNIQLLRAECNLSKSAKHPVEFMQERGFLI